MGLSSLLAAARGSHGNLQNGRDIRPSHRVGTMAECSYREALFNEGLSVLAELQLPWSRFAKTFKTQYLTSLSKALPKLELGSSKKTQSRGHWKRPKRRGECEIFCEPFSFHLSAKKLPVKFLCLGCGRT